MHNGGITLFGVIAPIGALRCSGLWIMAAHLPLAGYNAV